MEKKQQDMNASVEKEDLESWYNSLGENEEELRKKDVNASEEKVDWESFFNSLPKSEEELREKERIEGWKEFFDMRIDSELMKAKKLTFPLTICAPGYAELPADYDEEEELYWWGSHASYLEQELARFDGVEGIIDSAGDDMRAKFFHKYSKEYKFNFHVFYQEIYEALKAMDKEIGTQFSILFIESVMSYGFRGSEISSHPTIRAAMAGVKFLIDRERHLQMGCETRNMKRSNANATCKLSLNELFSD